jgi:hypothetical protein
MENPDITLGVEFFVKAVENIRRSKEEGRTIYEDVEYVRITLPGDKNNERVTHAHEMHYVPHMKRQMTYAERFKASYEAFKDEREDFVHGTPLSAVTNIVTPSEREELAAQKVRTVEQLAGLQDRAIAKLGPGWREKVERAQAFLRASEGSAEVDELKARIAQLEAMMSPPAFPGPKADPFDGFDRDDLYNMALDAGLEPRANASADTLKKLLSDAAAKKVAA